MARKLILSGPAAEAVERLARSAGVSPAELIQRALRREDEAQRKEAEPRAQEDAGSQSGSATPLTLTQAQDELFSGAGQMQGTFPESPASAGASKITSRLSPIPVVISVGESPVEAEVTLLESSEPPTGASRVRRVRVHEFPNFRLRYFGGKDPSGSQYTPGDLYLDKPGETPSIGELIRWLAEHAPVDAIEVPVPAGDIKHVTVEPSEDGRLLRISFVRSDKPPAAPGVAVKVLPQSVMLRGPIEND